jgi:hypothetical protein
MSRPLSDLIPLRSTAVWPKFAKSAALNVPYGRAIVPTTQYDQSRKFWHIADCAIGGVEAIYKDGKPEKAYAWRNATDPTGQTVALIELGSALPANATLTAQVRGKINPNTGMLLENPADILQDILRLAGHDLADAELSEFRTACADLAIAGLLTPGLTLRAQIAELAESVGMLWSPAMPGIARRWPVETKPDGEPVYARFAEAEVTEVKAESQQDALYTVLRVEYDWDWTKNSARRSVILRASTADTYGDRETTLQAKWITATAAAVARGSAWLEAYARPRWSVSLTADMEPSVPPGGWFQVSHPLLPVAGDLLAINAEWDWSNQRQRLRAEQSAGIAPSVTVVGYGGLFDEPQSGLRVSYANGIATIEISDPNGAPIRDAIVTVGSQKGKTDRSGIARIKITRGTYPMTVEAAGFSPISLEQTL